MSLARYTTWTIVLGIGFALTGSTTARQDPPLPRKDNAAVSLLIDYKSPEARPIQKEQLPKAREAFKKFAQYYADVVAHPAVHKASQEFRPEGPDPNVPLLDGPNGILKGGTRAKRVQ